MDDCITLSPIDDEGIERAEKALGVQLPKEYKQLLLEQNGGIITLNTHRSPVPTVWGENKIKIDSLMGIGEEGILKSNYFSEEWGMPKNLVFIDGDGHNWVALDYRSSKEEPSVIFIDNNTNEFIELAPTFQSFLLGLYEEGETFDSHEEQTFVENQEMQEITKLLNYINELLYAQNQKFVFEQYLTFIRHEEAAVREAVAAQVYNFVMSVEITEQDLFNELLARIASDASEHIRAYARFIEEA